MNWDIVIQPVGPLTSNAVLITAQSPDFNEAVLIDPGADAERLSTMISNSGCELKLILATHGHFDHVGAAEQLQQTFDLPVRCHADDVPLIESMPQIQQSYGLPTTKIPRVQADLEDGMRLPFAGSNLDVCHIPGHSPGQLMFLWENYAIVGDCLFAGSVGRTDLPGSSWTDLEKSIRERIYTLPDETIVVCGHGPDTTVGREKTSNPFVRP